jgi:hypothetical protein
MRSAILGTMLLSALAWGQKWTVLAPIEPPHDQVLSVSFHGDPEKTAYFYRGECAWIASHYRRMEVFAPYTIDMWPSHDKGLCAPVGYVPVLLAEVPNQLVWQKPDRKPDPLQTYYENGSDAPTPIQKLQWVAHCPYAYEPREVWLASPKLAENYKGIVLTNEHTPNDYFYCAPVCGVNVNTDTAKGCEIYGQERGNHGDTR